MPLGPVNFFFNYHILSESKSGCFIVCVPAFEPGHYNADADPREGLLFINFVGFLIGCLSTL